MSIPAYPYTLTPNTAEKLRAVKRDAEKANITNALLGHHVMESSYGRNLEKTLTTALVQRNVAAEYGFASMSETPIITEVVKVNVPRAEVQISGERFTIEGDNPDGSQTFDLTGQSYGFYAIILETWHALVGATTLNKATEPAIYAGVIDNKNKPDQGHFYPRGNIDRIGSSTLVPDDNFVSLTVVTQKFEQIQYRLRMVPDQNLTSIPTPITFAPDAPPVFYQSVPNNPYVVEATLPTSLLSHTVVSDGKMRAVKLAVVEYTGTLSRLYLTDARFEFPPHTDLGQPPIPIILNRKEYGEYIETRLKNLQNELLAAEIRLDRLEDVQGVVELKINGSIVCSTFGFASVSNQFIPFSNELADIQLLHDPITDPGRVHSIFNGRVVVNINVTFQPSPLGFRYIALWRNGLLTPWQVSAPASNVLPNALNLTAEISVSAGDYLEVEMAQDSGQTVNVVDAYFSVRRVL